MLWLKGKIASSAVKYRRISQRISLTDIPRNICTLNCTIAHVLHSRHLHFGTGCQCECKYDFSSCVWCKFLSKCFKRCQLKGICWLMCRYFTTRDVLQKIIIFLNRGLLQCFYYKWGHFRAVARALIGGLNIHIFVLCPTNFFWNQNDFKGN